MGREINILGIISSKCLNFYTSLFVLYIAHTIVQCLGTFGIVDYTNYDDMKYAIRKLDDTEFRNPWARAYIRVRKYEGSRSRSRSRSPRSPSRSRSPKRARSRSLERSVSRSRSRSRSASPIKSSRPRSRSRSGSPRQVVDEFLKRRRWFFGDIVPI
ncbi:hypothetical protein V8G54_005461 [Vigna mungo]|uniref:Uncharacterized protein n=1 Tax=Vigna mungo TaxID=3915 RepID=A0AAQ3S739_VIGMU